MLAISSFEPFQVSRGTLASGFPWCPFQHQEVLASDIPFEQSLSSIRDCGGLGGSIVSVLRCFAWPRRTQTRLASPKEPWASIFLNSDGPTLKQLG